MSQRLDSSHAEARAFLRFLGPTVAIVGLIFTIVGVASFFSSFGSFEAPRYFWCAFVGLPMLGVGSWILRFAYLGAVSRYVAGEVAPVGKDVVNYMAQGTKDAVRDLAAAVGEGLHAGVPSGQVSTAGVPSGPVSTAGVPSGKISSDGVPSGRTSSGGVPSGDDSSAGGRSGPVRLMRCHKCNADNEAPANFCKACGAPLGKTKPCEVCGELNDPDARFCDNCGKPIA